jgi:hypothetical protein
MRTVDDHQFRLKSRFFNPHRHYSSLHSKRHACYQWRYPGPRFAGLVVVYGVTCLSLLGGADNCTAE